MYIYMQKNAWTNIFMYICTYNYIYLFFVYMDILTCYLASILLSEIWSSAVDRGNFP